MIKLANNCYCSDIAVSPKNWQNKNVSIKKAWFIHFRFYDPLFRKEWPNGMQRIYKNDINKFKTIESRQAAVRETINFYRSLLIDANWNPITDTMDDPIARPQEYIISPGAGFINALDAAFERMDLSTHTKEDMRSVLKYTKQAIKQLRLDYQAISDVKRRHIIAILDQIGRNNKTFTPKRYNVYRKYLSAIFRVLMELEAIEINPIPAIPRKKTDPTPPKTLLTQSDITKIHTLKDTNYPFYRLILMFYSSGARTTEIMNIRRDDVDLINQLVTYKVNKGKARYVKRAIPDTYLHLWAEIIGECSGNQYLFGDGLKPADKPIRVDQVKRRWALWVQKGLGIKATWYSLKHLYTDNLAAIYGTAIPAHLNAHDIAMTERHYAVNEGERKNEILKRANVKF
jgi:integrase